MRNNEIINLKIQFWVRKFYGEDYNYLYSLETNQICFIELTTYSVSQSGG